MVKATGSLALLLLTWIEAESRESDLSRTGVTRASGYVAPL